MSRCKASAQLSSASAASVPPHHRTIRIRLPQFHRTVRRAAGEQPLAHQGKAVDPIHVPFKARRARRAAGAKVPSPNRRVARCGEELAAACCNDRLDGRAVLHGQKVEGGRGRMDRARRRSRMWRAPRAGTALRQAIACSQADCRASQARMRASGVRWRRARAAAHRVLVGVSVQDRKAGLLPLLRLLLRLMLRYRRTSRMTRPVARVGGVKHPVPAEGRDVDLAGLVSYINAVTLTPRDELQRAEAVDSCTPAAHPLLHTAPARRRAAAPPAHKTGGWMDTPPD